MLRCTVILLMLAAVVTTSGCGLSHNPSYFPYLKLPGDIIRTHPKPPGKGYFADFDPHARSLVVCPGEGASPVRGQVVLIATIYDEKNQPRRNRRVEWMLEGAGNIVEVDESGYFPGRGYKVDNKYAVSFTDYCEHRITRGNDNPNDDFMIRPGQSWCVITSAVEGDTHVTVYAPGIHNWEKNKIHVTRHWIDAQWVTPAPCAVPSGAPALLTTTIRRHSDNQPLAGYRVRYRLLDGPPAAFLPARGQEAVAVTDERGNASVQLLQTTPGPGCSRVGVEIIRAPDPTATSAPAITIHSAETKVDWQSPGLALDIDGPPALALNEEGRYVITLRNTGQLASRATNVRHILPASTQLVRAEPPASIQGGQLTWALPELGAGQTRTLEVVLRQTQPIRSDHRVSAASAEGLRDEKIIATLGTQPGLKLAVVGPRGGAVGVPLNYKLTLSNPGTGAATDLVLRATFDAGLESETGANPIELRLPEPLGPGLTRDIPLSLTPRQAGAMVVRVEALAAGNLRERSETLVEVKRAGVTINVTGPRMRFAGRPLTWNVEVTNPGALPLANTIVRQALPAEVEFVSATAGGQLTGRDVVWNLGVLKPGERGSVQLTVNAVALTSNSLTRALVTADPQVEGGTATPASLVVPSSSAVRAQAEAALEVRGVPSFRLDVTDEKDPLEVGGRMRYRIEVTNQGTLRGSGVQVTAAAPRLVRVLGASGPAGHRVDGDRIIFEAKDGLEPQQTWVYFVEVEALQAGDARFHTELRAGTLAQPVVVQQSTTIYAPFSPLRSP